MTDLRTAAQQALEALMDAQRHNYALKHKETDGLITALKAALAEPVQEPSDPSKVICPACCHQFRAIPEDLQTQLAEPVAWVDERAISWLASRRNKAIAHITTGLSAAKTIERSIALYTAPPQRKPLTREEIMDLCASQWAAHPVEVARLIERAHGIV